MIITEILPHRFFFFFLLLVALRRLPDPKPGRSLWGCAGASIMCHLCHLWLRSTRGDGTLGAVAGRARRSGARVAESTPPART